MKVRCIDDSELIRRSPITKGKIYPVIDVISECYNIINDNGEEWCYLKSRFEEVKEMDKEKVLEIEFQEVFDKVAWRVTYQNEDVLQRNRFEDRELRVRSCMEPSNDSEFLFLRGDLINKDIKVCIATKEEAEIIKQKVDAINEKYGIPKRWRAKKGEVYYYIDSDGTVVAKEECGTTTDDRRYKFGNYAKTKKELEFDKLEKIKQIFAE